MHLNKYLAHAGVCSRRKAVEYVKAGLVKVNGIIILEPAYQVKPDDTVLVDGKPVRIEYKWYIVMNKPKDYICTVSDERNRRTVMSLLGSMVRERVYPVGRLDRNTTGVLLLSNDGDLVQKLIHPKYEVRKVYEVILDRVLEKKDLYALKEGVRLEDGIASVDAISMIPGGHGREISLKIHSGKYRVIRRMFEALGYEVLSLDRTCFAGITKRGLRLGTWRTLSDEEIESLRSLCKE